MLTCMSEARLFWHFQNVASEEEADVDIFDVIGGDGFWEEGIKASDFVAQLRAITAPRINLHINSPGGYVNDGLAMYAAIQQHPAEVVALIESQAASIASVVAMAADKVLIAKNAKVFIHDALTFSFGNAADFAALVAILNEESDNIAGIYAEKAGGDVASWRAAMQDNGGIGTSYRGQEAIDAGLADELIAVEPRRNLAALRNAATAKVRNSDLTVCMASDCDQAAVLALPLCKEHVEAAMALPEQPDVAIPTSQLDNSFASRLARTLQEASA